MGRNCWAVMLFTDAIAVRSLKRERDRENRTGIFVFQAKEKRKRKMEFICECQLFGWEISGGEIQSTE